MNKSKITMICAIVILVLITVITRFWQLDKVPASLYFDEIDAGYQAKSLLTTHKEYGGCQSIFYICSIAEPRTPLPIYLTAITTLIFSEPAYQIRGASALLGISIVLLIFILMQILNKKFWLSYVVAAVFAVSPWQIQFSRWSHEVNSAVVLILISLIFFFLSLKQNSYNKLVLFTIFASIGVYTYRTMSLFAPLFFGVLMIIYFKEIIHFGFKKLLFLVLLSSIIIVPFLYYSTIGAPEMTRIQQISIISDAATPIKVQRSREVDSGDFQDSTIGKSAVLSSYFFHNKVFYWVWQGTNNYLQAFSVQFLFISGDPNPRHSIGERGMLFYTDILAFIAGIYILVKNRKIKFYKFLALWLLVSPIVAAITNDGAAHAARLFLYSTPLLIVVGFGWFYIISHFITNLRGRLILGSIIFSWLILFIFYLHNYYSHYPIHSQRWWGYGLKQAILQVQQLQSENDYQKIYLSSFNDPPEIYYFYWANIPPSEVQAYGTKLSDDIYKNQKLDKIRRGVLPEKYNMNEASPSALYVVGPNEIPDEWREQIKLGNVKMKSLINYLDNEKAFYIISTK